MIQFFAHHRDNYLDKSMHYTLVALFVLSLLAVIPLIKAPLWGLLAVVALWGIACRALPRARLNRLWPVVMMATLAVFVIGVLMLSQRWLSAESVTGFILLVTALKLFETKTKKESLWLICAFIVLAGIGTLYWSSVAGLAYILLLLMGLVIAMAILSQSVFSWSSGLWLAVKMYLLSLPLALVLFFVFPRISGPLWDLGLAFGMPMTLISSAPPQPLLDGSRLKNDKVNDFLTQSQTVLVAEFDGKVPYKSDMYWRGPVFYQFDGQEWSLEEGSLTRTAMQRGRYKTVAAWKKAVKIPKGSLSQSYKVRVMPHRQRWLFALDTSTGGAPEVFLSRDFQLLSIRPINKEFSYRSRVFMDYQIKPDMDYPTKQKALQLPDGNPRLQAYGKTLTTQFPDPNERLLHLYERLRGEMVTTTKPAKVENNPLDALWFTHKKGNMLDVASAMAVILRASGMPTRAVAGYRGGTLVALTDFVIVKQSNTHIWLETWFEDKGWVRVEPQDYIGSAANSMRQSAIGSADEVKKAPNKEKKQANAQKKNTDEVQPKKQKTAKKKTDKPNSKATGGHSQFGQWFSAFDDWMMNYDTQKQSQLMAKFGGINLSAIKLLVIAMAGLAVLIGSYIVFLNRGSRSRRHQNQRLYARLQKALSKYITAQNNECPSIYLNRLQEQSPQTAQIVAPVINYYIELCYGNDNNYSDKQFAVSVKRAVGMLR